MKVIDAIPDRILKEGTILEIMTIEITQPGGNIKRRKCFFCQEDFKKNDERINTCTLFVDVTLCRSCYDKAGNTVR